MVQCIEIVKGTGLGPNGAPLMHRRKLRRDDCGIVAGEEGMNWLVWGTGRNGVRAVAAGGKAR